MVKRRNKRKHRSYDEETRRRYAQDALKYGVAEVARRVRRRPETVEGWIRDFCPQGNASAPGSAADSAADAAVHEALNGTPADSAI